MSLFKNVPTLAIAIITVLLIGSNQVCADDSSGLILTPGKLACAEIKEDGAWIFIGQSVGVDKPNTYCNPFFENTVYEKSWGNYQLKTALFINNWCSSGGITRTESVNKEGLKVGTVCCIVKKGLFSYNCMKN